MPNFPLKISLFAPVSGAVTVTGAVCGPDREVKKAFGPVDDMNRIKGDISQAGEIVFRMVERVFGYMAGWK